jgi:hypothetical protein
LLQQHISEGTAHRFFETEDEEVKMKDVDS